MYYNILNNIKMYKHTSTLIPWTYHFLAYIITRILVYRIRIRALNALSYYLLTPPPT